jgi:hypothetical protein
VRSSGLSALLGRFFGSLNSQGWIGLVGCGLLAFLFIRAEGESRHWHKQSDRYEKLYNQEHSGRIADRKSYVDAQASAAELNKKQIAHVKQQQQEITDEGFKSTLALASSLLLASCADKVPPLKVLPVAPQQATPAQAPCRAIDPAWLCLSPEDRLSAAESEERHDELIDWVIAQSKSIRTRPETSGGKQCAATSQPRILIVDIETKLIPLLAFGIRDQHISINQIVDIPQSARGIHCIGMKWHGERKATVLSEWEHGYSEMIVGVRDALDQADAVLGSTTKTST